MLDWDLAIFAVAGYLAIVALVRLLQRHRRTVLLELQNQVDDEQRRQELDRRKPDEDTKKSKSA